jgi:hypothetical protein
MKLLTTQREAWEGVKENLAERQRRVLEALDKYRDGLTSHEYADLIGQPLHAVSGRFSELRQYGRIVPKGKRRTPSGKQAIVWAIPQVQGELFQ